MFFDYRFVFWIYTFENSPAILLIAKKGNI